MMNISNSLWNITSEMKVYYKKSFGTKWRLNTRFEGGTSQGKSLIFFMLGGSNSDLLLSNTERAFSGYKENLMFVNRYGVRGFTSNYRNGNTYFLNSTQLSLEVLELFLKRPIASEVFSNLDVHTFVDLGTSFYGKSIFDPSNVLNTRYISSSTGAIFTEVRAFKNPFIISSGIGIGTQIYGYKISIDYAFGFEDQSIQPPVIHLGLGVPF